MSAIHPIRCRTSAHTPNSARVAEASSLSGSDFSEFYERLKKIRGYHLKYPDQPTDPFELELGGLMGEEEDLQDLDDYEDRETIICILYQSGLTLP